MTGRRVIDLCAGIGSLAFAYYHRNAFRRGAAREIVCVEQNPDYVAVGRKVLPEATWILANVPTAYMSPDAEASHQPRQEFVIGGYVPSVV